MPRMDLRPERMPEGLLRVTRWDDIGVSSRLKACGRVPPAYLPSKLNGARIVKPDVDDPPAPVELDEPNLVHPNIVGAHRAGTDFTGAHRGTEAARRAHSASWKMIPAVCRRPDRMRLTPCRRFTRYTPRVPCTGR